MKNIRPFIKWVGGKRQFIKYIDSILPNEFKNYHEPFVGGGAVFFHLLSEEKIKYDAYINDLNTRLIRTYEVVKNNPKKLMSKLDEYRENSNEDFYKQERIKILDFKNKIDIASWFIYVNKAGFNGMYRVNSSGGFNVPYGHDDNKRLYDEENIIETSKAMKSIDNLYMLNVSFEIAFDNIKKGDFVFVDPPYDYDEDKKNGFTRYVNPDFKREFQILLSKKIKEIDKKGAFFLKTNHDTKLIRELYADFDITVKPANRSINSNAKKRSKSSKEVFIKNY